MINLLPHEARRLLLKEYSLRVATVWAFLCTAALLGVSALFLPSYLLIESEKKAFETEETIPSEAADAIADIETEVVATNELAAALKARMTTSTMTGFIRAAAAAMPSEVRVSSYEAKRAEGGIEAIRISGVAASREALTAFQKRLEEREEFLEAEVPIDDFVKEKDLPFEITVSIADNLR